MKVQSSFADRVRRSDLDNGARLLTLDNPHAPTATIAGTLTAGPALAADGRFAVPGLTAAMLERGTESTSRFELARELEGHGLQLVVRAAASSPATVSFSVQGLAEELPRMVRLLSEVLRRPVFPADELERLREQILGSLVREREDTQARAYAALTRHLYPDGHPLRRRPIETREREVASITSDELAAFHRSTYGPSTLAAAVVGAIDHDGAAALIADGFDGWVGGFGGELERPAPNPPQAAEERVQIADRPNLDVFLGHAGKLVRGADDYAAAVVANSCLGQSTLTSRLGVEVRDRAGLTYGISSRFFGTLKVPGPWAVVLGVSRDHLERAVAMSREVIAAFVDEGPREDELGDERTALAGSYRVGLATNSGVARELLMAMTAGEGVERLDRFPEQLLAVSREQVMAAVQQHLHPEHLVMTAAGDFGE